MTNGTEYTKICSDDWNLGVTRFLVVGDQSCHLLEAEQVLKDHTHIPRIRIVFQNGQIFQQIHMLGVVAVVGVGRIGWSGRIHGTRTGPDAIPVFINEMILLGGGIDSGFDLTISLELINEFE